MPKILIKKARLAFPQLWEPKQFNGTGKARFSATFLVAPGSEDFKNIEAAVVAAANEKWGAKAKANLAAAKANGKMAWKDGVTKPQYEGYEGMWYLAANSTIRPTTLDREKQPTTEADGLIYAGCYVQGSVDIYAMDEYGLQINAGLKGVRFMEDGDAFSGSAPASADDFSDDDDIAG